MCRLLMAPLQGGSSKRALFSLAPPFLLVSSYRGSKLARLTANVFQHLNNLNIWSSGTLGLGKAACPSLLSQTPPKPPQTPPTAFNPPNDPVPTCRRAGRRAARWPPARIRRVATVASSWPSRSMRRSRSWRSAPEDERLAELFGGVVGGPAPTQPPQKKQTVQHVPPPPKKKKKQQPTNIKKNKLDETVSQTHRLGHLSLLFPWIRFSRETNIRTHRFGGRKFWGALLVPFSKKATGPASHPTNPLKSCSSQVLTKQQWLGGVACPSATCRVRRFSY